MAQVVKHVISSQNFLAGLLSLPHYAELRVKQLDRLLSIFRGTKLTLEQAGTVLNVLDERLWDVDSLGRLKSALADQTVDETEDAVARAKCQDYSALPLYVSEDLWLCFEKAESIEEREKALELACELAAQLGLRNPTEETCAVLYVLAFTMHPMAVVYDCEKLALLQKWKPIIKRHLKKYPVIGESLKVLPVKVEECPAIYIRGAFPHGWKCAKPHSKTLEDVLRLGRTWPLRVTRTFAAASKATSMQMPSPSVQTDVLGVAAAVARQTSLAVAQALVSQEEVPGLKILKPLPETRPSKPASVLAAILDKDPEPSALSSKAADKEAGAQEMIDALCADLEKEKQEKEQSKKGPDLVKKKGKKPKAKAGAKMKRPAAASACLRRPAAAAMPSQRGGLDLDPDPRRSALLNRIPKQIRLRFAGGCSRCRYREFCTTSCWAHRGYT